MIDLYNTLKFITMQFFIQKILTFNLGVAFLKSVSIYVLVFVFVPKIVMQMYNVLFICLG